jgi:hypothetical protein
VGCEDISDHGFVCAILDTFGRSRLLSL